MRIRQLTVVGFLAVAFAVTGALPADASCAMSEGSLEERLADSRFVFVGTVDAVSAGDRLAQVTVESVWRGKIEDKVTVIGGSIAPGTLSSVDRTYAQGTRYLFVPHDRNADGYQDNICTDTRRWRPKFERLRPEGAAPVPDSPPTSGGPPVSATPSEQPQEASGSSSPAPWIAGTALAALAAVVGVGTFGRRRT